MTKAILVLDQGTSSTRAMLFSSDARILSLAQRELPQAYPNSGWVEQDPEIIWTDAVELCRQAVAQAALDWTDIDSMGITNQRETVILWNRVSGEAIAPAIVWLDRRTSKECSLLRDKGLEPVIQRKTGLLLDPYFSATKIAWLLDQDPDIRHQAERGELVVGTIDSFLVWRLSGGQSHVTDYTNASRTLLFNIFTKEWDEELLEMFRVPLALLPQTLPTSSYFGATSREIFGRSIPICGVAGDQQAALIGQTCFAPGMAKCTFGTGSFLVLNTGTEPVISGNRLLTTLAYDLDNKSVYALEGSSFVAGATVQWLRDGLKLIDSAKQSEELAQSVKDLGSVYLVPAFSGLGAPYWDPDARAAIIGITRATGVSEIVTAGLMSVAYQTRDLVEAMRSDGASELTSLRVDGGMVVNNWLMQALADILGIPIERPKINETTALGAAMIAGLYTGFFPSKNALAQMWQSDSQFTPRIPSEQRERLYAGWLDAVRRTRGSIG